MHSGHESVNVENPDDIRICFNCLFSGGHILTLTGYNYKHVLAIVFHRSTHQFLYSPQHLSF